MEELHWSRQHRLDCSFPASKSSIPCRRRYTVQIRGYPLWHVSIPVARSTCYLTLLFSLYVGWAVYHGTAWLQRQPVTRNGRRPRTSSSSALDQRIAAVLWFLAVGPCPALTQAAVTGPAESLAVMVCSAPRTVVMPRRTALLLLLWLVASFSVARATPRHASAFNGRRAQVGVLSFAR